MAAVTKTLILMRPAVWRREIGWNVIYKDADITLFYMGYGGGRHICFPHESMYTSKIHLKMI